MTYQEITMWLTVANSVVMVVWGILITRKINKQNRTPRPGSLDELWRDFADEHREELTNIIRKTQVEKYNPQDYRND